MKCPDVFAHQDRLPEQAIGYESRGYGWLLHGRTLKILLDRHLVGRDA